MRQLKKLGYPSFFCDYFFGYIKNKLLILIDMNKFLNENGNKIIIGLLVLLFFKSCMNGSDIKSLKKEVSKVESRVDSLPTKNDIIVEGLKVEKRMIQSTDRKILDVNRQSEIDREISKLNK